MKKLIVDKSDELFSYLKSRNFTSFPKLVEDNRSDVNVYEFVEDTEIPTLSEEALQRLNDYCMDKYPINPFIINYDETAIEQLPNETLFKSITPEIVAYHMDKFDFKRDMEFAEKYGKSILEVFPERYYEDTEEGIIRRVVDNLIADPDLRYLDDKPMIDEKIENEEITEEVVEETEIEESSEEVVE